MVDGLESAEELLMGGSGRDLVLLLLLLWRRGWFGSKARRWERLLCVVSGRGGISVSVCEDKDGLCGYRETDGDIEGKVDVEC